MAKAKLKQAVFIEGGVMEPGIYEECQIPQLAHDLKIVEILKDEKPVSVKPLSRHKQNELDKKEQE